ncbi:MAG: SGNH/GDSL hydrolase family protein [Kiritimatiellaeota bacterium]|nr:SGNH/GDSL hydrolase family protein [Kiritimatiellota bacterium]
MKRVKSLFEDKKPRTWVFYGDSITHGAVHTFGGRDYAEHFSERVRTEMGRSQDIVIKSAISGDNTRGLLNTFDWRVSRFEPDAVFIMIGMNDCAEANPIDLPEFENNMVELCAKIDGLDAIPVLQTTCPILPGMSPDRTPYFNDYMNVIRKVAADAGWPLIDHTFEWERDSDKLYYKMSNAFHPNAAGHIAFAHTLFKALDIWDPASFTCQLFFPKSFCESV